MQPESPLDFLARAHEDPKLAARVRAAIERGNRVMAEEVLEIAHEFGYSFSRRDFERDVKRDLKERLKGGEREEVAGYMRFLQKAAPDPPESSCAKGCLSWSVNYCPDPGVFRMTL
jgi:hypothetical protein